MIRTKPTPAGVERLKMHGAPAEVWVGLVPTTTPSRRGVPMEMELHLHATEENMRRYLDEIRPSLGARAPWLGFSFRAVALENLRRMRPDTGRVVAWVWGT